MIIKYILTLFVVLYFMVLPSTSCKQGTESVDKDSTDLVVITKLYKNNEMPPVKMSHQKHEDADVKCITCHHKDNNDDRIKVCSKCHMKKGSEDVLHDDLCIGCHEDMKRGPTDCEACHKEEK